MKELTSEEWFSCIEQKNLIRVRQLAVHIREAKKKNKLRKDKKKKNIVTEFGHYNEQGDAAIHMAIRLGYLDIVALLLVNGANIEQRNSSHHTPLMVALLELQLTIATFLIQRGANPFLSDGDGYSILHLAVKTANKDIVKSALTWEMTLNAKDVQNRTPLHHASLSGNFEIVKMLVEAGVNILEKDLCGSKALHLASNKEVKEYLEEKEKELKEKRTSFSEETSADEPEVQQESAKIYDSSKITVGHPNLESDNYYAILGVDETFDSGSLKKVIHCYFLV
jgi:ankyrin repeat protein